jgi:hypothetical protein
LIVVKQRNDNFDKNNLSKFGAISIEKNKGANKKSDVLSDITLF